MSVYQQPQSYYGAQSYPAPAFAAPSVYGSYYHQQPPVAPVHFMDPHSFRREYSARLADLTVNSRPIIQNLSMLAHEYSRYAEIVSECLQLHIQRVSRLSIVLHRCEGRVTVAGWMGLLAC